MLASTLLLWAKTAANENIRCATVNAICGLITASEGAREKIYSQNGLQIVADCLHTSNTENSISACAQTLTALARTSRDRKVLCCHRYAVSDLVQASQTRSEATSKKCAACLKEIALEYSCHQLLLKCCALEATSIFLRKRPADAAVKLLLIFWHNLSCTKSSWARFGPHLDILNVYLKHSSAAMQSLTLCILCNVLSHPGNCEHFGRQAVFQSVMDHNSPLSAIGVSTKACFVLQNALRFSAHCRKTFAEKGGVSMMMRLVLIYEESDIRESALTVALMTIQHIPTECYHVLSSITQLLEILSYDLTTFEVAVRILKLLSFLAKIDDATRQKIVAANAISVIVQFFITPDNLGDSVVLKHQKDGDRILALKIGTAFMSLLSHSKKVLTRLVSHGGLAMIISVLAEHSVSPLPEEIVVNSSIFLANLSADRKGLNDIVLTCGIPVILKSAVVIATAICSSQSELHSPYRMRKFPALRGLPSSPQGTIPPYENCSQAIVNSPENIKLSLDVESAKAMGVTNSSVSSQLTSINNEGINTSSEAESTGLLVKHTESPAVLAPDGLPMPKSLVTAPNLAPENLLLSPDAASSKISLHDGGAPASDGFSWLSLVGKPVASRLIKCIICASIARFESTESAVECCLNQVIDRIESVANEEKAPKEVENVIEGQIVVINDATIALESHDSKFFVEASHCIDELHQKPDVEEAKLGNVDVHASLRLTVEDIITRAEEFIEQRARGGQYEDVVPVDDRLEWLKTIDVEDIWGKEKFFDFEKSICASDFDAHFQKQKKQINGKRSTSISLLCYKMTNVRNMLTNSSRQKSHCSLGTPGTALALLVKCLQNLCAGEPAARKQVCHRKKLFQLQENNVIIADA